ncbi:MAG: hypothetical protein ABJA37_09025 [Ferruginibacter sp.]
MNPFWHFLIMMAFSFLLFILIISLLLKQKEFALKRTRIFFLALIVVVVGMFFGKYGATAGLPWWIYYPVPMIVTVLLPPISLKLNSRKTILYLILSFLSAPFIHVFFSFFFGWKEYMPFWNIPFIDSLVQ